MKKLNNEAKCAIVLCVIVCIGLIAWSVWYYFDTLQTLTGEKVSFKNWYNFASPILAIANIIAFIGLTVAIYIGESGRQKNHEKVSIQKTIINKVQIVEIDLKEQTKILYKEDIKRIEIYDIYISLYRYFYYFKNLPDIPILESDDQRHKDAKEILEQITQTRDLFIKFYNKYDDSTIIVENDRRQLAIKLNVLIAYLEAFEISIINNISFDIVEPD